MKSRGKSMPQICHTIRRYSCLCAVALSALLCACTYNPFDPHKPYYDLSIRTDGHGFVDVNPPRTHVLAGSTVTLTARPDTASVFAGFSGDVRSFMNPLAVTVDRDMQVITRFVKHPAAGMAGISAAGRTFLMGSPSADSQSIESPPHRVRFEYDYFIDKYEVTQGMYATLMGENPSLAHATQGTFGIGDSFPVSYVSWYDAALFCNSRSKKEGYDTVYSYSAVCGAGRNCPYVLENLVIHYDRMGYRLPTEAEWEYACRAGSESDYFWGGNYGSAADKDAGRYAWYAANSGNATHPVGRVTANGYGLYDMAGNVSEFVNDWLEAYRKSLLVNTIGPAQKTQAQYEASAVRPVRGGCFELGLSYLRSSGRIEPYPMPAYTASRHVGFRTVMGAFFADTASPTNGHTGDSLHVTIQCGKSGLIGLMTTSRCKIVFVKDDGRKRRLCFLDFTAPAPAVQELMDSVPAFGPSISPNGSSVAYGSKGFGFPGPSVVTVRPLDDSSTAFTRTAENGAAFLPSWTVDTLSLDTFMVYTTGASMNNLPVWKTEKTLLRKMSGFSFSQDPVTIVDTGSFYGGMSRNWRYLATGYPRAFFFDRNQNNCIRYFLPPQSGRDDTAQVCNVSITPSLDRPDELLFLDFGYGKTSSVVGKPYGFHSVLFRCNSAVTARTHVARWYEAPEGFAEWNDVRWSNHPDFAIAVAKSEASGSVPSLFIINLRDSAYLPVASGQGLAEPYLWIDPAALSERPDPYRSFAKYDVPTAAIAQVLLTEKLKLFWTRRDSIEVGVFGSSSAYFAVDPSAMNSYRAINMATLMGELLLGEVLTTRYFLAHAAGLRAIVMALDPGFMDSDFHPADPFLDGLYDSEGFRFDKSNNFWQGGIPSPVLKKISAFNESSWPDFGPTGNVKASYSGGWGTPVIDKGDFQFSDTFVQANLASIKTTADTLAARGIHLFVVNFPESPAYATTASVGRYGPSQGTFAKISQWLQNEELANPYFHFYDANNNGYHDYTDAEAMDANHLGYLGARKFSRRLDSLLSVYVK
jgi:formylglycine-generating enzyme required for sulfatase activity